MPEGTPHKSSERRRFPRHSIVRPCKIRDRRNLLFSGGRTTDLSVGGALIRVDRARPFRAGDEIDMVVAWSDSAVVASEHMLRATIKRVLPIDYHHQALAVEFAIPEQELAAAA